MLLALLFLLKIGFSAAALPASSSGVTCPPGGLWSSWSTSDNCSASCGSCAKQFYTRTCLSASTNCNCTGVTSRYLPCNTKTCVYPAERTCCIPYVPMLLNGTFQCGPIPRDTSSSTSPCCPSGGLWSSWSSFSRSSDDTAWVQTRQCVSTSAGCPCTGSSTNSVTACPCGTMQDPATVAAACGMTSPYFPTNNVSVNDATCTYTGILKANNDDNNHACSAYTTWTAYQFTPAIFLSRSGSCPEDRPFDCQARFAVGGATATTLPITFHCNLETLKWNYDMYGYDVDGFLQLIVAYGTG